MALWQDEMMKKKLLPILSWVFIVTVFSLAAWSIYRELHAYRLSEILNEIRTVPRFRILLSLTVTFFSYAALTGYDFLGVRYAGRSLPYRQIALTSFISYIFSNNIGLSAFSGSAVRYRLYSSKGLSAVEIVKVIGFCLLTFWIGLIASASFFMIFHPVDIPSVTHLPFQTTRPLGLLFAAVFSAYLLLVVLRKRPLVFRENEFRLPDPGIVPLQLLFSLIDWTMAGLALYILLPRGIGLSFPAFLGLFILAQTLAVISSVPGGVGIFESLILLLMAGRVESSQLFSALFLYRLVYYLIPLASGMGLFLGREILRNRKTAGRVIGSVGSWISGFFPTILSILTFTGGVILIFSGTTPVLPERREWLKLFIPFPVMETSHFMGSLSGLLLLILALGILNRTQFSYFMTLALFLAGGLFSLLKGLDYEESAVLLLFFLLLVPCRGYFYRKARITPETLSWSWFVLVSLVLISSIYLGLFSYRHIEYSNDLWWRFEFHSDASRFLRASLGSFIALFTVSVLILIRSGPRKPEPQAEIRRDEIPELISAWGETEASLAYLPDKHFLYHRVNDSAEKVDGFLMYGVSGKTWIAMGDPVGPDDVVRDLIWQFRQETHRYDSRALFYEVGQRYLPYYIEVGFSLLKIGENAVVDLETFTLEGHDRGAMRNTLNRFGREGFSFEILDRDSTRQALAELKVVSDNWLEDKRVREKGFSLGYYDESYLTRFRTAVVRDRERKILAFANIWESPGQKQISVDLMRYLKDSPPGLMDYLFIQIMQQAKREGFRTFDMGMAPFAGLPDRALAPVWNRLGAALFRHGEDFYNFQGLRRYKNKFGPRWEPRFIALQGGLSVPRTLLDLTSLINGGLLGAVSR